MAAWDDLDVHLGFDISQGRNFNASNSLTTVVILAVEFLVHKCGNSKHFLCMPAGGQHQTRAMAR